MAFFSTMCLVFLLWNQIVSVLSLNQEGLALLSFREPLTDSPTFSSWNSSDETPCSWRGVTCKEYHVVSLVLPNRKLSGTLNADLGSLSVLCHLNLRDNELVGVLPLGFFRAKQLRSLILAGNSFSGKIPPEIGDLRHLSTLDLSRNSFNGSIPENVARCRRLKLLYLSSNKLTGFIPSEFGDLSNLKGVLNLSCNFFSGEIPASLGNIPETVYVDLSYNNLSGKIPQVDTLLNSGPTAFLGNPFLCNSPLNNPCSDQPTPERISVERHTKRCRLTLPITLSIGVLAGALAIAIVVSFSRKRIKACSFEDALAAKRDKFCSEKHVLETMSESMENYTFVRLDQSVDFCVDRLLTASAFFLGKSGAGIVYQVELQNGVSLVVRRLCEEGGGGDRSLKEFRADVEAIGKIKHPNMVALRAYCWSAEEKLLVYDHVVNGDLATAIHGTVLSTPLSWPVRLTIMKGIARGLTHLHEHSPRKYVHGNLKPTNILLGPDMDPRISDLGLHRLAKTTPKPPETEPYRAPEASGTRKPSQKWDVYSFGAIVLEMIAGKVPEMGIVRWFRLCIDEGKPFSDVVDPILAGDLDLLDEIVSVMRIALACVHTSPEKRPTMKSVGEALARLG